MDISTEVLKSAELKLCINCKHVGTNASRSADTYRCFSPRSSYSIDLVSGDKIYVEEYCRQQRSYCTDTAEVCSMRGNWFEPKPVVTEYPQPVTIPQTAKIKIKAGTNLLEDLGL